MLKYKDYQITFQEVPDEVSICINITGCSNSCKNCHSPELRKDIGEELTIEKLENIIKTNKFATCICFMGGDQKELELIKFLKYIKNKKLKTALYSGSNVTNIKFYEYLDYYKFGEYKEELGGLNNPNTNQRIFEINKEKNITYKFWALPVDSKIDKEIDKYFATKKYKTKKILERNKNELKNS